MKIIDWYRGTFIARTPSEDEGDSLPRAVAKGGNLIIQSGMNSSLLAFGRVLPLRPERTLSGVEGGDEGLRVRINFACADTNHESLRAKRGNLTEGRRAGRMN